MNNSRKRALGIMSAGALVPLLLWVNASNAADANAKAPTTQLDKLSYSLGVKTAENFVKNDVALSQQQFSSGFSDALSKRKLQLTDKQMQEAIDTFQKQHIAKIEKQQKKIATVNSAKAKDFLAANKRQPNVKTMPSGLQYIELTAGQGVSPKPGDQVTVNYRGTLIDGTEFDSSYARNEPITIPLVPKSLIPGWEEALLMMKPGSKWKIFLPPTLGYGDEGAGQIIEPGSALIFEIEFVSVKPKVQ